MQLNIISIFLVSAFFTLIVWILFRQIQKENQKELQYIHMLNIEMSQIKTLNECQNLINIIHDKYLSNKGNDLIQEEYKKMYYKLLGMQSILNKISSEINL